MKQFSKVLKEFRSEKTYSLLLWTIYMVLFVLYSRKYGMDLFDKNFLIFLSFFVFFELLSVRIQSFIVKSGFKGAELYVTTGMIINIIAGTALMPHQAMLIPFLGFLVLRFKVLFSSDYWNFLFNVSQIGLTAFLSSLLSHKIFSVTPSNNPIYLSFLLSLVAFVYFLVNLSFIVLFLLSMYGELSRETLTFLFGGSRVFNLLSNSLNTFIIFLLYKTVGIVAIPLSLITIISIQVGNYYAARYREAKFDLLIALTKSLEEKDPYTAGHGERVADLVDKLATKCGFSKKYIDWLKKASLLHDVGKIGIPDNVLIKTGKLSKEEYEIMKEHSRKGYEILKEVNEFKNTVAVWVKHHHERWDGEGYPDGLKGDEIPLESRMITLADVFDALTSDRPYRAALTKEQAIEFLKENSGVIFDPSLVELFLELHGEGKV
ncbi:HD domain-containing protein [Thermosipho ferrireducens]|uniref:HD domain-containing protein n=1 Tax=Thermosipho ferrireducens TaxID=2571116 RepID=A0ABX7S9H9_9BACT|nr:HD domain-containing phosphohydrolase [Thermosipho ferrireducens]QTA38357.1 HD domain-containing protein [Thermosipho ferrireducens]